MGLRGRQEAENLQQLQPEAGTGREARGVSVQEAWRVTSRDGVLRLVEKLSGLAHEVWVRRGQR